MGKLKTTMKLEMRFGDYGVRHATIIGKDTSEITQDDVLDLVKYEKSETYGHEYCYVVGTWRPKEEGYDFESCGKRLFELDPHDVAEIWPKLKAVHDFLDSALSDY